MALIEAPNAVMALTSLTSNVSEKLLLHASHTLQYNSPKAAVVWNVTLSAREKLSLEVPLFELQIFKQRSNLILIAHSASMCTEVYMKTSHLTTPLQFPNATLSIP